MTQPGNVVISGQQYWVDAGEADQGVTGNGKTVKAIADLIGTTNRATLVFDSKSGASTSYVFTTAWDGTTYPNLHFEFKNGGLLAPGSAVAIILPGPSNVIANPSQQIITGAGTVTFAKPGTVYPEWWGVDGTADNVQATAAYDSLTAGGKVVFQAAAYGFAANATIRSNIVTEIKPWTTITLAATASGTSLLYALSESNIQIIGYGTLNGNRANITGGDYAHGIFLNTCSNATIRDIKVTDAYKDNIYLESCTNVRIYDCNIEESAGNGIMIVSSNNVKIRGCYFDDNLNTAGTADILIYTGNVDVLIVENTFREGGAQITGQGHAIYSIGSTGVRITGNYAENKYGYAVELQQAATDEGAVLVGNYFKNCGNETDQTGGLYVSGENNLIVGNFITGSAIDAMTMTSADGTVIAGNILTNSGDAGTDGYGIRFSGAASTKTIIANNSIRDTQDTKTMMNALYLSAYPAIVVGNMLYETEDGYPYLDLADQDHVFSANLYGVRSAGYHQGDRVRKAQYVADLLGNVTFDRNNFSLFFVGASGANRNLNPVGEWYGGDDVWIKNTGNTYNVVFDSAGLNQAIAPGQIGYFVYDGLSSTWTRLVAAGTSLALTGVITGLMPSVNVLVPSGTSTDVPSETVLTHAADGSAANAYVGMTLYNVTDGVSGTVTASTSTTITVAAGSMSWADTNVYQLGPGPDQSGSMFYVGTAGTIRHPATAGYYAGYFVNVAGVVTVDMASDSMIFQGVLNSAFAVLDAGDCIDSPATQGSYFVIHNKSATEAVGLGFANVWLDGGAS